MPGYANGVTRTERNVRKRMVTLIENVQVRTSGAKTVLNIDVSDCEDFAFIVINAQDQPIGVYITQPNGLSTTSYGMPSTNQATISASNAPQMFAPPVSKFINTFSLMYMATGTLPTTGAISIYLVKH